MENLICTRLNSIDNLGVDNIVRYGFYFICYMFVILDLFHTSVKGYLLKILDACICLSQFYLNILKHCTYFSNNGFQKVVS